MGEQLFLKAFAAQRLAAPPAAGIADDFRALPIIERDGRSIGLGDQVLFDEAGRSVVTVGVKMPAQILVDEDLGGVAVIGGQSRQGAQGVGTEAIAGALAGFAMQANVGHLRRAIAALADSRPRDR